MSMARLPSSPLHSRTARGVGLDCLELGSRLDVIGLRAARRTGLAGPTHISQAHTHGFVTAGDPSAAAGAPVSKRRFQTRLPCPLHSMKCRNRLSDPWRVRLLEFIFYCYFSLLRATLRLTLRAPAPSPSLSRQPGPHLSPLTRFRGLCLSLPLPHPCPQALRLLALHRRRPVTSTGP